jgi:hypothetical protein
MAVAKKAADAAAANAPVDVSRVDIRVGTIVKVRSVGQRTSSHSSQCACGDTRTILDTSLVTDIV